jgi:hypothetical protein
VSVKTSIQILFRYIPGNAWGDSVVAAILLVATNGLLTPQDPGWIQSNPSPYFLLPILIGCRYGAGSGIMSGVLGAGCLIGCRVLLIGIPVLTTLESLRYLLLSLPVAGAICGELMQSLKQKALQAAAINQHLQQRLKKLDGDLLLLREAKADLERMLATRNSDLSNLDSDMRRLFEVEGEEFYKSILLLLSRQTRITDAGIYLLKDVKSLDRIAIIGQAQFLPESMPVGKIEMVALAITHKTPLTIPEFWQQTTGEHKNYLMAVPLLDTQEAVLGVILVTGMPFIALTKRTVNFVSLICRWASRVIEIRSRAAGSYRIVEGIENQKIYTPQFFKSLIELALTSFQQHKLPSSILFFYLHGADLSMQETLEKAVMPNVRGADFAAEIGLQKPHLAVLLPLTGDRGALIFLERIKLLFPADSPLSGVLQSVVIPIDANSSIDGVWKALTQER